MYKYKRNLKRHILERHLPRKHWKCVKPKCASTFIRRGYLLEHLTNMHKYTRSEARTATLNARREGDESPRYQYYEDISSDDEILDLLNEGPAVNEIQQMDILNDFDISKLDPVSSVDGSHNDVTPDNSSVVSAESSVSVSVEAVIMTSFQTIPVSSVGV